MASYTGNLNLKKPALDDDALITDINNNMDILDAAANGIQDALAIVANGNTHAAISAGQFVYVRNHTTLTEGLYVASSNIAANATLSTSNLTADSAGGLNALNSNMATKVPTIRYDGIDDNPSVTDIGNAITAISNAGYSGAVVVNFYRDNVVRMAMYYSAINSAFGAGFLVGFYGDSYYKILNSNGTVTKTAITSKRSDDFTTGSNGEAEVALTSGKTLVNITCTGYYVDKIRVNNNGTATVKITNFDGTAVASTSVPLTIFEM